MTASEWRLLTMGFCKGCIVSKCLVAADVQLAINYKEQLQLEASGFQTGSWI